MLFTVSTVKDSLENVEFFVAANLASGVDHLVVFLDAPEARGQAEVATMLDAHPHVTYVPTARGAWWADDRPNSLNVRQRINANWTRSLLEPFAWADWLFHIDGDEVACVDREALDAVPAGVDSVWLPPWEAVSEWERVGRPTRFKRLLEDGDLNLLHVLGVLPDPSNQSYFHGHVMGKSGVRPGSGIGLTLHEPVTVDGGRPARHEDPRLRVLHYDAPSGEEFVRKWRLLAKAGPTRYRPSRQPTARALMRLVTSDLPAPVRNDYLRRIYDLTTRDDVQTLGDLQLLVEHDPLATARTPESFPAGAAEALADRAASMSSGPKGGYYLDDPRAEGKSTSSRWRRRLSPKA